MTQDPPTGSPVSDPPHGAPPEDGKRAPWGVGQSFGIFLVAFVVSLLVLSTVTALEVPAPQGAEPLVGQAAFQGAFALVVIGLIVALHGRFGLAALGGPRWPRGVLAGAGMGLAAFLLINIAAASALELAVDLVGGEVPPTQEPLREAAVDPDARLLFILGVVVLAPIAEEVFFRGVLFTALRDRLGLWPAAGISSVLFGLTHAQDTLEGSMLLFLLIFPLGMLLAWLYDRTGSLLAPIVAHAMFNGGTMALIVIAS